MLFMPLVANAQYDWLGKIKDVELLRIVQYPSHRILKVKFSIWRKYTNNDVECIGVISDKPIKNIESAEDLSFLLPVVCYGHNVRSGYKQSEQETVFVEIPLSNSLWDKIEKQPMYFCGYLLKEQYITEFLHEKQKTILCNKTDVIQIDIRSLNMIEGDETTDRFYENFSKALVEDIASGTEGGTTCDRCKGNGTVRGSLGGAIECTKCQGYGKVYDATDAFIKGLRRNLLSQPATTKVQSKASSNSNRILLNGHHTKNYENGDKYIGDFKYGACTGKGTYIWSDGGKYVGEVRNNQMHGRGVLVKANGDKYDGEFYNDTPDGNMTVSYANGAKYIGEFFNDHPEGKGTMYYANGDKFEGVFEYGGFIQGKYTWASGETYEGGYFRGSLRNGQGTYTWPDGTKYEGEFKQNEIEGTGKFTYPNGEVYEGQLRKGLYDGKGKRKFANGETYEGDFYNGTICGYGKYTWSNGDTYEGNFSSKGVPNIRGYFKWVNGNRYEGENKNGIIDGYGTMYYKEGNVYKFGKWVEGELINIMEEGTWEDGNEMHFNGEVMSGITKHKLDDGTKKKKEKKNKL